MTNHTPHPTDALPLPEPFAALSDDETPALYKRWADQIRAARRDGYELAMNALAAPAQEQPRPKKAKKQPKCEEGRECEAPDICKSVGRCMRA